jgi:hypothetical protein
MMSIGESAGTLYYDEFPRGQCRFEALFRACIITQLYRDYDDDQDETLIAEFIGKPHSSSLIPIFHIIDVIMPGSAIDQGDSQSAGQDSGTGTWE